MKTLAEHEAERRTFLETLKPELVEVLDAAVADGQPIDRAQLHADIAADLEDRTKHPKHRWS